MADSDFVVRFKQDSEVSAWESREIMTIEHKGKEVERHYDGGEPEDSSFRRDWSWVAGSIKKAYKLGFKDGNEYAISTQDFPESANIE